MKIKNFLNRLDEYSIDADIMHPENISTLSDLDTWKETIDKAFKEYKDAGGYYNYQEDFEKLLSKMRKKKWYKDRVRTGEDVAREEKKIREKQGKTQKEPSKEKEGEGFKIKVKEKNTSGIKNIKLGKIERGKNNLWTVEYEGQEFNLGADAILHMLMKDQKGEVNESQ